MRLNIFPPSMVLASKCGRINLIQFQATIYFQSTEFSILLLYALMLIITFLLSLCQDEFLCNKYIKSLKHYYYFIIYFTKEPCNSFFFFFSLKIFIRFVKRQQNKKQKKRKRMPTALDWQQQRKKKKQKQRLENQDQEKKKPRKENQYHRACQGTPPQRFLLFF